MVDLEEEQRYEQLRKLGQELHIPIPEAFWELEVRDKHGRLIQRHRQRSHSWVRNAYNMMFSYLAMKDLDDTTFGAGKLSLKKTDGDVEYGDGPTCVNQQSTVDGTTSGYRAAGGVTNRGIIVGSGTTAESFEDYFLETMIDEGAGAGQLNYATSNPHVITWTPATKTLKNELVRYINNNSGGDVDVNEVGIAFNGTHVDSTTSARYMTSRDVLPTTVTVPDTGQLKVTYTIQLTYPE